MYSITFEDNTTFLGGEPSDSKWNKIPDKLIKRIEYSILNQTIIAEGYESYNHLVERASFVVGKGKSVRRVLLLFKRNKEVLSIIIDLVKNKIYSNLSIFGKEYKNKPVTGWKKGILKNPPKITCQKA